jgi:Tripartite tricarboxylate transporter TctB family
MPKDSGKEKVLAVILFGFSCLYLYGCLRLKLGILSNPGPGFIPLLVGVLLFVSTGAYLYRLYWGKDQRQEERREAAEEGVNLGALLGILASVISYPFLLGELNFILSTLVVLFAMLVLLKFRTPFHSLVLAAGVTVVSFLIFGRFFGVALPSGLLEELLYRLG